MATIALTSDTFEQTVRDNDIKAGVPVFSQAGALPAPSLQKLVDAIRALDVEPRAGSVGAAASPSQGAA